jgi:iron complex outermembrane receptor protein
VEVLRGPQGTLFGKNTTGGTIHVLSRLPTFTPEAAGELSLGENGWQQARGSVSGPLGEQLAARLSVQATQRDGVLRHVRTGHDLNTVDNYALRGQLLWQPADALSLRLTADVSGLDSACCTQSYLRVGSSLRSPARQFPALAAGLGYAPPSREVYDRLSDIDVEPMIDTQDGGVSLITDWQLAGGTLTSVSAWRYWDWDVANDRDYTGIPIQRVQRIPSRQDQYSQELRYASSVTARLRHVSGVYWFRQDIGGSPVSVYGPEAAYWLLNPGNFNVPLPRNLLDGYAQTGRSQFAMRSRAVFAEANYDLTPTVIATLGLRYTHEDKRGQYETQVSGGPDLGQLPAATRNELTRARLSIFRPQSYRAQDAGGNLSGRANLAWQFSAAVMTYASAAYGYKSGGLNMSGLPLDAANRPALATAIIDDERNTTLELGVKSTLLQGRATLNLAAFHTTVRDYQTNVVSSLETAALRSYPANVPEVRVRGLEADLLAAPLERLTLRASLTWAAGEHRDYPAGPCPLEVQTAGTSACDLSGTRLPGLSRWVGSIGVDHRLPLGAGELVWHLDALLRSGYNSDTAGSRYTAIAGHAFANASLGYQFQNGWFVAVFARNLFDRDYLSALTVQTGNSGLILGQPSDPRLLGVSLRARW